MRVRSANTGRDPRPGSGPVITDRPRAFARLFRLLAAVGLVAVTFVNEAPVTAAGGVVSVDWKGTLDEGGVPEVSGDVYVQATVSPSSALATLTQVRLELVHETDSSISYGVMCSTSGSLGKSVNVAVYWDTTTVLQATGASHCNGSTAPASGRSRNGKFRVRILVTENWVNQTSHHRRVDVSNSPNAPQNVGAVLSDEKTAAVSWVPNLSPDLDGYLLERCHTETAADGCDAADWTVAAVIAPEASSFEYQMTTKGAYRFRLFARRPAASGQLLVSPASDTTSPVTYTPDDGGGGGGGGGGDDDGGDGGGDGGTDGGGTGGGTNGGSDGGSDDDGGSGSGRSDGSNGDRSRSGGRSGRSGSSGAGGTEGSGGRGGHTVVSTARGGHGLPPRFVSRTDGGDGSYEEALPYGWEPDGGSPSGPLGLLSGERGAGLAAVPVAAGLLAVVFGLQIRYLNRRALQLAAADAGAGEAAPEPMRPWRADGDESFVTGWRRWLRPDA